MRVLYPYQNLSINHFGILYENAQTNQSCGIYGSAVYHPEVLFFDTQDYTHFETNREICVVADTDAPCTLGLGAVCLNL